MPTLRKPALTNGTAFPPNSARHHASLPPAQRSAPLRPRVANSAGQALRPVDLSDRDGCAEDHDREPLAEADAPGTLCKRCAYRQRADLCRLELQENDES